MGIRGVWGGVWCGKVEMKAPTEEYLPTCVCPLLWVSIPMWDAFISPLSHNTPPHTPLIPITPLLSYFPISVVPSLVSTHIYLCSLTFSIRPDEAVSVWW